MRQLFDWTEAPNIKSTNESIEQRNKNAEKEMKTETINILKVTGEEETGQKLNPAQNNKDNEK